VSRFYFDIQHGEAFAVDDEGMDLDSQREAEIEAAISLADIARELDPLASSEGLAIEVRDRNGPLVRATFIREKGRLIN
jgi:hypothetical protein